MTCALPPGPWDIIVADPPWHFASNSEARPGRNVRRHYPTMRDPEIAALPLAEITAADAMLFLWTTAPMLERSMAVANAWRPLRYKTNLVWPKGKIATGYVVRGAHELCLVYRRGRLLPSSEAGKRAVLPTSIISGARREHSRKPDWLQDQIDRLWPGARKLELFARAPRNGWTTWGNDTERFSEVGRPPFQS